MICIYFVDLAVGCGGRGEGSLEDGRSRRSEGGSLMRDSVLEYLERVERNMERERQRDERNEEYRHAEDERIYQRRLVEWERVEKDKIHERERYRERLKENEKERGKLIKMDNETFQDEDVPAWKRKPYRMTTRAHTRAHRRQTELEDDEEDRRREQEEDRKRAKKRKAEEELLMELQEDAKKPKWQELTNVQDQQQVIVKHQQPPPPARVMEQPQAEKQNNHIQNDDQQKINSKKDVKEVDASDPIFAAMVAAAAEDNASKIISNGTKEEQNQSSSEMKDDPKVISEAPSDKRSKQVLAVFKTEEDEKKPRKLVPIQYSAEELRAQVSKPEGGTSEDEEKEEKVQDPQQALRLLADKIPKYKEQVWKYKIRWDRYDVRTAGGNIRKWLSKKSHGVVGGGRNQFGGLYYLKTK
eukprot:TRINITY_DN13011_c0_g1_i3.p1 TRINITY_DN13011_c0_g1~~TRINITY_DN13011_c0_g1_i3.p1  ORF type:complete len:413 (-),score=104.38 TRINITY_DN13011_c0_g1_i3:775-2013(-)